jgi:5-oxoprolinase (ATP-hydrolysing) subunit A
VTLKIDLSADLGEASPREEEIWPLITRANVACGGHTGDTVSMQEAARLAKRFGVKLGAHPSYPDREHFGRRSLSIASERLRESLVAQLTALRDAAALEGIAVRHVKPHGALYNDAHSERELAAVVVEALMQFDSAVAIVCGDSSALAAAARACGVAVNREAFADRRYTATGSLVPRGESGALLSIEESVAQVASLVRNGSVVAIDGARVEIAFDTICIHADMGRAVERLRSIRAWFDKG